MENLKFKLNRLINLALGLALIDGGLIIGIQICDFLATYFFISRLPAISTNLQNNAAMGGTNLILILIGILNLSAIILRITGIARGTKYSIMQCYLRSIRSIAPLYILYFLAVIVLLSVAIQISKIFTPFFPQLNFLVVLKVLFFLCLPYAILTCANVVDQNRNIFQAIKHTYGYIRNNKDFLLLTTISCLYSIPSLLETFTAGLIATQYLKLFSSIWFLFCHLLSLVMYIDNFDKQPVSQNPNKPTKIVII